MIELHLACLIDKQDAVVSCAFAEVTRNRYSLSVEFGDPGDELFNSQIALRHAAGLARNAQ